ncbi:Opioid growth factor receptor [Leucoagaricus sp. SymC.cos]|nr:Opioid growth factor receptor [Leucoagaricus sp. SymC.cos]
MPVPRDVLQFLNRYPSLEDDHEASQNLKFYSNALRCRPDGLLIDEIHDQWLGDFRKLEYEHGFIQWLFPIRENGVNWESQPIQPHEIEAMKTNTEIMTRVVRSYELMLDFYGMRMLSLETGLLGRALRPGNYESRYRNLVVSSHNYLRISRILKCLSELGLEHLNAGFLLHVLNEQSEFGELVAPGLQNSMDRWWANCIRNHEERAWVGEAIRGVRGGKYVFTRQEYEKVLRNRKHNGTFRALGKEEGMNSDVIEGDIR